MIKLKRSAVALKVPTTTDLSLGEIAVNTFDGELYLRGNNGLDFVKKVGGSSASVQSQRGIRFYEVSGVGPNTLYEYDVEVKSFEQGRLQSMIAYIHVPNSYSSGSPISLRLGHYTSGIANNYKFQAVTTLVRKGVDAINSVANQYSSTNADQAVSSTSLRYNEVVYDLSTTLGLINSVGVSAGDILKVAITRVATSGTDDSNDVRTIPSSAEFLFS